ncbi:hypothetical protein PHISCL_00817 [Aspergillus sclerotialis]|uniref:Uncharacterized protein n=1 Tax=Aspergillus sclerotialis TaxID=2070753 RepID=A0A3A2ZUH2_9EURO|nr:hypothetical protein PHISCL_00817 [Aspergillus sclerotialis]
MQVAEILSDLTSLRVCDHNDALALVTVNEKLASQQPDEAKDHLDPSPGTKTPNEDLRRAKELVDLHYEIKAKHANGTVDDDLLQTRAKVNRVLSELGGSW